VLDLCFILIFLYDPVSLLEKKKGQKIKKTTGRLKRKFFIFLGDVPVVFYSGPAPDMSSRGCALVCYWVAGEWVLRQMMSTLGEDDLRSPATQFCTHSETKFCRAPTCPPPALSAASRAISPSCLAVSTMAVTRSVLFMVFMHMALSPAD